MYGRLTAFNARTGDHLGRYRVADGSYSASPLVGRQVKLRVVPDDGGAFRYRNATMFTDGDPVTVRSDGGTHLDFTAPAQR
ncbi:hypothetical protein [Actinoallomurus sp. NPDC052274]|uniref:hypothetical protein n=1 Tax=Actinoallomurus sp. NPDC052274 TaxID=3155420 RepID=UPI00341FA82C